MFNRIPKGSGVDFIQSSKEDFEETLMLARVSTRYALNRKETQVFRQPLLGIKSLGQHKTIRGI